MNKEILKEKIGEFKQRVGEFFSKMKNFDWKSLQSVEYREQIKDLLNEKIEVFCTYFMANKIICVLFVVLLVWNILLTHTLKSGSTILLDAPTSHDFEELRQEFDSLESKFIEFEDTYVYKIEDLEYTVEGFKPRLENLEDYSHTHY